MSSLKHFYVGVKGVVYNPDLRKCLLLKRKDQDGRYFWDLPGGRINDDETIDHALSRELDEELPNIGYYRIERLLSAYRLPRDLKDGYGLLLLFYEIESFVEDVQLSKEHESFIWVGMDDLDTVKQDSEVYIEAGYLEAVEMLLKPSFIFRDDKQPQS